MYIKFKNFEKIDGPSSLSIPEIIDSKISC